MARDTVDFEAVGEALAYLVRVLNSLRKFPMLKAKVLVGNTPYGPGGAFVIELEDNSVIAVVTDGRVVDVVHAELVGGDDPLHALVRSRGLACRRIHFALWKRGGDYVLDGTCYVHGYDDPLVEALSPLLENFLPFYR